MYDPCDPHIMAHAPEAGHHPARHAVHHHPLHPPLGRRVARWQGPEAIANRCFKARPLGPKLTAIVSGLASPAALTVAGMTVLGAGAFGGASLLPTIIGPPVIIPGVRPPPHHHHGGGSQTSVPEPGTAAILAVAMVVVLFGAWLQGGRALRGHPESTIASTPLRRRRPVPAPNPPGGNKDDPG